MPIDLKPVYLGMGDLVLERTILANEISPSTDQFPDQNYGMLLYWPKSYNSWLKIEAKSNQQKWITASITDLDSLRTLAQMGANSDNLGLQELFEQNCCLLAITNRNNPVTLQFSIFTSTREIKSFAANYRNSYPNAVNVPLKLHFKAFDFRVVKDRTKKFLVDISFSPMVPLHPYEGYVSIDLGNFSTGICALPKGKFLGSDILGLTSDQSEPKLNPEIETVVSQVRIDAINTWFDNQKKAKEAPNREYPDPKTPQDRLSPSSQWVIGTTAEDGNKCRQVAGPKRLMAKSEADPSIPLELDHHKHYPDATGRDYVVEENSETIHVGNRLPAELLIGRMLEKFGQAIPERGDKPAGWPQYLAATYPTSYTPMEIHALRKTIYGAWRRTFLQSVIQTDQNNPTELARKSLADKLDTKLGNTKVQNHPDKEDPLIRLMIDEATAASFFFLFKFAAESPGGLRAFHYQYPDGMNLLLYDCGGGTTDIALVQAKVNPKSFKQVNIEVLGRSGVRHFGGDDITWAICKLLKAKIIARALRKKTENFDKPININEPQLAQMEKLDDYSKNSHLIANGKAIQTFIEAIEKQSGVADFVPTTFKHRDFTNQTQTPRNNANILWSWGENIKHRMKNDVPFVEFGDVVGQSFNRQTGSLYKSILEATNGSQESSDAEFVEQLARIRIYRSEIDAMIARSVVRTISCCKNLIEQKFPISESTMAPVVIHKLAVTGKASNYPMICGMIQQRLKISDLDPKSWLYFDQKELKSAVAKGATQALAAMRGIGVNKFIFDTRMSDCLPFDVAYRSFEGNSFIELYKHQTKYNDLTEKSIPIAADESLTLTLSKRFPGDGDALVHDDEQLIDFDPSEETTKMMKSKGYTDLITWEFPTSIAGPLTVWYDSDTHTFEAKDKNGVSGKPKVQEIFDLKERAPRQRGTL